MSGGRGKIGGHDKNRTNEQSTQFHCVHLQRSVIRRHAGARDPQLPPLPDVFR
jgi:hypothetical protein